MPKTMIFTKRPYNASTKTAGYNPTFHFKSKIMPLERKKGEYKIPLFLNACNS